jgi:hypothetical protein
VKVAQNVAQNVTTTVQKAVTPQPIVSKPVTPQPVTPVVRTTSFSNVANLALSAVKPIVPIVSAPATAYNLVTSINVPKISSAVSNLNTQMSTVTQKIIPHENIFITAGNLITQPIQKYEPSSIAVNLASKVAPQTMQNYNLENIKKESSVANVGVRYMAGEAEGYRKEPLTAVAVTAATLATEGLMKPVLPVLAKVAKTPVGKYAVTTAIAIPSIAYGTDIVSRATDKFTNFSTGDIAQNVGKISATELKPMAIGSIPFAKYVSGLKPVSEVAMDKKSRIQTALAKSNQVLSELKTMNKRGVATVPKEKSLIPLFLEDVGNVISDTKFTASGYRKFRENLRDTNTRLYNFAIDNADDVIDFGGRFVGIKKIYPHSGTEYQIFDRNTKTLVLSDKEEPSTIATILNLEKMGKQFDTTVDEMARFEYDNIVSENAAVKSALARENRVVRLPKQPDENNVVEILKPRNIDYRTTTLLYPRQVEKQLKNIADGTADRVIDYSDHLLVYSRNSKYKPIFDEIYRVLKPGGKLEIGDINIVKEDPSVSDIVTDPLKKMTSAVGFGDMSVENTVLEPSRYLFFDRGGVPTYNQNNIISRIFTKSSRVQQTASTKPVSISKPTPQEEVKLLPSGELKISEGEWAIFRRLRPGEPEMGTSHTDSAELPWHVGTSSETPVARQGEELIIGSDRVPKSVRIDGENVAVRVPSFIRGNRFIQSHCHPVFVKSSDTGVVSIPVSIPSETDYRLVANAESPLRTLSKSSDRVGYIIEHKPPPQSLVDSPQRTIFLQDITDADVVSQSKEYYRQLMSDTARPFYDQAVSDYKTTGQNPQILKDQWDVFSKYMMGVSRNLVSRTGGDVKVVKVDLFTGKQKIVDYPRAEVFPPGVNPFEMTDYFIGLTNKPQNTQVLLPTSQDIKLLPPPKTRKQSYKKRTTKKPTPKRKSSFDRGMDIFIFGDLQNLSQPSRHSSRQTIAKKKRKGAGKKSRDKKVGVKKTSIEGKMSSITSDFLSESSKKYKKSKFSI